MKRYRAIAEFYDPENEGHPVLQSDVPFFLGQMPGRPKRQSVLELAVGTARAAIPVAQAGHRVVGVDYAKDMLDVARRKRDAVGVRERDLELIHADVTRLDLGRRFDWVCVFFNTFCAFTTLEQQDRVMQAVIRHLKPAGRFWLDVFQPDLKRLGRRVTRSLDPTLFYVPRFDRSVLKTTDVEQVPERQLTRVTFNYTWHENEGDVKRARTQFDLTWIAPRELRMLVERHGLVIEHLFGNYDGSAVADNSPRMIARCRRA